MLIREIFLKLINQLTRESDDSWEFNQGNIVGIIIHIPIGMNDVIINRVEFPIDFISVCIIMDS